MQNTMAEQNVPAQAPTRIDEQIVPRSQWLQIGKNNLLFASASVPSVYIQQFWNSMKYDKKTGVYSCQVDEQWFNLSADLLRKALDITPVDPAHPFELPPTGDTVIDFVNQLRYPEPIEFVSNIRVNYVYQPWRAILTLINQCLTGKTSGGIQTFFSHKASHKASLKDPKKKSVPLLIPYRRFTKTIIYYLGSTSDVHKRHESPCQLPGDNFLLGNLKFISKGETNEVFGMAIPKQLITQAIQQSSYYPKYLEMVAKNTKKTPQDSASKQPGPATKRAPPKKPATATPVKPTKPPSSKQPKSPTKKPSKRKLPPKVRKGKPSFQLVDDVDNSPENDLALNVDHVFEDDECDAFDSDVAEDDDDDEGPSAGSNQGKSLKRRRHDSGASGSAQPPPKDDEQSSKKPQDFDASASKQHPTLTSTGWQITDTRDAVNYSSMHSSEPESGHSEHSSEHSSDDASKQDEGHVSNLKDTDNAHIPKVKAATWFKPIQEDERPATPEPEWTIPSNDFLNQRATGQMHTPHRKKKLCKANLEGPAFNLVKAFHKNNIFLQFQMDECHKLLTNKVDLVNPEGHPILHNIYEPLPLGGPPGQVTIQPQFFFNKDLEYLLTGDKERKTALSISKLKAARYLDFGLEELEFYINKHSEPSDREAVRSQMRILSVIRIKTFEKYRYNYLRETILRRADYKEYKISEKDFKNLYPNDFEDLYLLNIQDKLNHLSKSDKIHLHTAVNMWIRNLVIRNRVGDLQLGIERYQTKLNFERPNWDATDYFFKEDYTIVPKPRAVIYRDRNDQRKLMRLNEIHNFSNGTLTRVMEKLDHMVKDFHLFEYNKGMETRKWSEDDKRRSKDFITAIEKRLQIRRIFQSLESFVGGRIRDIDYRLINRTT
ncbi:hypothetical protein Tco_0352619 [Tanacetum coccineum]